MPCPSWDAKYLIPSAFGRFLHCKYSEGESTFIPHKTTLCIVQPGKWYTNNSIWNSFVLFDLFNHGLKGIWCEAKIFHRYLWWCTLIRVWIWWVYAGYAMKNIAYTFWALPILSFTDADGGEIIMICKKSRIYKYKQLFERYAWIHMNMIIITVTSLIKHALK